METRKRGLLKNKEYNFDNLKSITNYERNDCLHVASEKGYQEIIRILMSRGLDATCSNKQKNNPLHVAVAERKVKCVEVILEKTSKLVEIMKAENTSGNTPMKIAINKHQLEIVNQMLSYNNVFDDKEYEDLVRFCASCGNKDMMESLYNKVLSQRAQRKLTSTSLCFRITCLFKSCFLLMEKEHISHLNA